MTVKVNIDGKEITYGAYTKRSHFSEKEWLAIYSAILKHVDPEGYENYKYDDSIIMIFGRAIDLAERYEALLELLPQTSFSKAGTHPEWVAEEVAENTYDKFCVQSDMKDLVNDENLDGNEIRTFLTDYFQLKVMDGDSNE